MPSIAAANPKNSAFPRAGCPEATMLACQVSRPAVARDSSPTTSRRHNETRWNPKMTTATREDSPIPRIVSPMNTASSATVVGMIGMELTTACA